jgi:hypothetical protein
MRLFIYKTIFIFFCLIIAYKFTIDNTINKLETKFESLASKEKLIEVKIKIREEIKDSINKDRILKKDDAILLKKFINKINNEISQAD